MRTLKITATLAIALLVLAGRPDVVRAEEAPADAQAAYADIKKTLGLVPSFLKAFPGEAIAAAWDEYKGIELNPDSALPGKYKELIGLAVAAQVPCRYCSYFHTEAARLNGADSRELKEAVVMASITRKWSAILNGQQTDEAAFRTGMDKVFAYVKQPRVGAAHPGDRRQQRLSRHRADPGHCSPDVQAVPAGGHRRSLEGVQDRPAESEIGNSREVQGVDRSGGGGAGPLPLLRLLSHAGRQAQWCHDQEIGEALAMAGLTRHWSTFLNGTLTSESTFRKEVDQIVAILRKRSQTASR